MKSPWNISPWNKNPTAEKFVKFVADRPGGPCTTPAARLSPYHLTGQWSPRSPAWCQGRQGTALDAEPGTFKGSNRDRGDLPDLAIYPYTYIYIYLLIASSIFKLYICLISSLTKQHHWIKAATERAVYPVHPKNMGILGRYSESHVSPQSGDCSKTTWQLGKLRWLVYYHALHLPWYWNSFVGSLPSILMVGVAWFSSCLL